MPDADYIVTQTVIIFLVIVIILVTLFWFFTKIDDTKKGDFMDILLFGADWCGTCHTVKQKMINNSINFIYVDVEVEKNGIYKKDIESVTSLPTLIVKINGAEVKRCFGSTVYDNVKKYIRQYSSHL